MSSAVGRSRVYESEISEHPIRHALAVSFTVAILVTLAILGNELKALLGDATPSSQATVVYKNQAHPTIGELETRAAAIDQRGKANSDEEFVFPPRSQGI